jgi:hypothetical protein
MAGGRHYKQGGTPVHVTDESLREQVKAKAELAKIEAARNHNIGEHVHLMQPQQGKKAERRATI